MSKRSIDRVADLASDNPDDVIVVGSGSQVVHGGKGDDVLFGGSGPNALYGDAGDDVLIGGTCSNVMRGGRGDDILISGSADSTLQSSGGYKYADHLYGGAGTDRFVFTNPHLLDQMNELAWIGGYHKGEKIDLSGIDANAEVAGDQAFVLVDHAPRHAGEAYVSHGRTDNEAVIFLKVEQSAYLANFVIGAYGQHVQAGDLVL